MQGLSTADYRHVMKIVEEAILSTDLALYFRKKDLFLETANQGEIDWQEHDKKDRECMLHNVWRRNLFIIIFRVFCSGSDHAVIRGVLL